MPNQHKRAPLSIRLPEAEDARLRAYAEERRISLGEAIRLAVRTLTGDEVPDDALRTFIVTMNAKTCDGQDYVARDLADVIIGEHLFADVDVAETQPARPPGA
jgi:hypothetical protein